MREDQKTDGRYRKDADFEQVISLMNESLAVTQEELIGELPEEYPTVHIIGAPRSGTTLAGQILAENMDIGYINNLIAAFWKAPLFGIRLSNQLLESDYRSSYRSEFGRTNRIQEPHEFGYFWNHHLKYEDFMQKDREHEKHIDWVNFTALLKNMCRAFDKPLLFKSFLFGFHAREAVRHLGKTCFIYIRRNIVDNAISLLHMREKYLGDVEEWASIKPLQYDLLARQNRYVQVAGQVLFIELEYLKQLKALPAENTLMIDYEDMCQNPVDFLTRTNDLVAGHFRRLDQTKPERDNFTVSRHNADGEVQKIRNAVSYLLGEYPELEPLMLNRKSHSF